MTTRAHGRFDVKMIPHEANGPDAPAAIARLTLDKHYHGDLEGPALGTMLSASSDVEGSAGYVAIEQVTGTLHGRSGTFLLQHSGIMARGEGRLTIEVVPDSGTGELKGLSGTLAISFQGDDHIYDFDYSIDGA